MKNKLLSVIIPCYNEESNIIECIKRVPHMKYGVEIIVVDDGSKDKTYKKAKSVRLKNLKVIKYKKNRGRGYAFRTGLKIAKGDVVIILDADMTSPPEEIPDVVSPIYEGKADFVNGSRFVYPMEKGAMKWIHIPGNRIFALVVSILIRQRLTDSLCGFKAFRRDMLPHTHLNEDSWIAFELLLKARKNGLRIVEVPIHYKARKAGISKMKTFKDGYNLGTSLLRSILSKWKIPRKLFLRAPLLLFG